MKPPKFVHSYHAAGQTFTVLPGQSHSTAWKQALEAR